MKYYELKEKQSQELNAFPIHFAFSTEQFQEVLKKLGVKETEVKGKLFSVNGGGYIRKTDSDAFDNLFKTQRAELDNLMQDDDFMVNAIEYELGNHEFCITYDPTDTIAVLLLDMSKDRVKNCFKIAKTNYLTYAEA